MPQTPDSSHRFDPPETPETLKTPESSDPSTNVFGGWLWAGTLALAMLAFVTLTARPPYPQAASWTPESQHCPDVGCLPEFR